jgi:hypothetical protein
VEAVHQRKVLDLTDLPDLFPKSLRALRDANARWTDRHVIPHSETPLQILDKLPALMLQLTREAWPRRSLSPTHEAVQTVGLLYKRLLATVRTSKHQDNPLEKSTNIVSNHVVVASKLWNMFVLLDINNSSSYSFFFFVYQFGIILNPESSKLLDDIFDQLPTCGYGSPNWSTTN